MSTPKEKSVIAGQDPLNNHPSPKNRNPRQAGQNDQRGFVIPERNLRSEGIEDDTDPVSTRENWATGEEKGTDTETQPGSSISGDPVI